MENNTNNSESDLSRKKTPYEIRKEKLKKAISRLYYPKHDYNYIEDYYLPQSPTKLSSNNPTIVSRTKTPKRSLIPIEKSQEKKNFVMPIETFKEEQRKRYSFKPKLNQRTVKIILSKKRVAE